MSPKILSIIPSQNSSTTQVSNVSVRSAEEFRVTSRRVSKPKPRPKALPVSVSESKQLLPKTGKSKSVAVTKVKKVKPVKIIRATPDFIYQAIGKLDVQVILRDRTFVSIAGKEFRLLFNSFKKGKTFTKLQGILAEKGHDFSMIVYPQFSRGCGSEGNVVSNSAFTFVRRYDPADDLQNINRVVSDLAPGHFILSGLWQTDRDGANYIQILRNDTGCQGSSCLEKKNWSAVPVTWDDCTIQTSKSRLFVTIEAKFDTVTERFIFVRLLCTPRRNRPRYQKITRLSLRKRDCPRPILRSARSKKDFVKPILVKKSADTPKSWQLGLKLDLDPAPSIEKYPESELKVLMGYARTSPVSQIKNIQEAIPIALLDRQGNNIGVFVLRREGRTKYWEKVAA
jgi:hypothetical protein